MLGMTEALILESDNNPLSVSARWSISNFKYNNTLRYQNFTNGGTAPAPASNDTFKRDLQSSHFKLQNASYNSYQTTNAQHFH